MKLAFLLSAFWAVRLFADEPLIRLDGKSAPARLLSISDGQVGYADESSVVRSIAMDQIVRWGSTAVSNSLPQVVLVDGSILNGSVTRVVREVVTLETDLWGELQIPRSNIATIIWSLPPTTEKQSKLRDSLFENRSDGELLTFSNGDTMKGKVLTGNRQSIQWLTSSGPTDVRIKLLTAWSNSKTPVNRKSSDGMELGLNEGTKLVAKEVRLDDKLHVELQCGLVLGSTLGVRPVDEQLITYVRPSNSGVRYLSDLKPLGYKHVPFLGVDWPWRADRSVIGGPLSATADATGPDRIGGPRYFSKGLGMHSTSRLAFEFDRVYDEFHAEVCLDSTASEIGSVVFRVFGFTDGKWSEFSKSPIVRGGERPVPIRVPLRGARRLALVVDYADGGGVMDRANWIGARVMRQSK